MIGDKRIRTSQPGFDNTTIIDGRAMQEWKQIMQQFCIFARNDGIYGPNCGMSKNKARFRSLIQEYKQGFIGGVFAKLYPQRLKATSIHKISANFMEAR